MGARSFSSQQTPCCCLSRFLMVKNTILVDPQQDGLIYPTGCATRALKPGQSGGRMGRQGVDRGDQCIVKQRVWKNGEFQKLLLMVVAPPVSSMWANLEVLFLTYLWLSSGVRPFKQLSGAGESSRSRLRDQEIWFTPTCFLLQASLRIRGFSRDQVTHGTHFCVQGRIFASKFTKDTQLGIKRLYNAFFNALSVHLRTECVTWRGVPRKEGVR
jgi:hypothetical protein